MRQLKVHVLDVGHGDTIIIEMPIGRRDKAFGVVDCIKWEEKTRQYLEDLKVEELEFVCGTHPHEDHVGDILKLLQAYEGNVGEYWDSGKEHTLPEYIDILEYLYEKNIQTKLIKSGNMVSFGDTKLHILAPPARLFLDSKHESFNINNASIVIQIEYGNSRIMLSGDSQFANWAHMRVAHRDHLKTHALKISHHGSKHGNFLEVLEVIEPTYAIISAGTRDLNKFPHRSTIESLEEIFRTRGLPPEERILNTKDVGNIVIKSTGSKTLKVETEK